MNQVPPDIGVPYSAKASVHVCTVCSHATVLTRHTLSLKSDVSGSWFNLTIIFFLLCVHPKSLMVKVSLQ